MTAIYLVSIAHFVPSARNSSKTEQSRQPIEQINEFVEKFNHSYEFCVVSPSRPFRVQHCWYKSTSTGSRSRAGLVPQRDIGLSLNKLREARLFYALGFSSTTWRTTTTLERTGATRKLPRRHIALCLTGWLAGRSASGCRSHI